MLRRFGKRGMDDKLMFVMWEIIVIVMVVIILTISVRGISNNTTYWKRYHSTDLALMSDLMLTNQGDFVMDYNMKEMKKNFLTKLLYADKLVFQTSLKDDTFYLYQDSADKDRFPQMYTFATYNGITINNSDMINDYLVLYKTGDTLGIKDYYTQSPVTCPSANTHKDLTLTKFEAISTDNSLNPYRDNVNAALNLYGRDDKAVPELLIVFTTGIENNVYYDTTEPISSGKISCIVARELTKKYPDTTFKNLPYNNFLDDNTEFKNKLTNSKYYFWIIIQTDGKIAPADITSVIDSSIKEYYK